MKSIFILSSVLISTSVFAHDNTEMNNILNEYLADNGCPNVAQIADLYDAAREDALTQTNETNVSNYHRYQTCVVGAAKEYARTTTIKSFEEGSEDKLTRSIKSEESTLTGLANSLSDEELMEELF